MPTEYTGLPSIDGTRILQEDGEHCRRCGTLWPREETHVCLTEGISDLTDVEIERVAEALRRSDYMNWTAREVAEKIAPAIRAIADERRR